MDQSSVKLTDLKEFISCPVCHDFLIDATTVSECLHTFCKTCITKHIKNNHNECPKCNTIIHERRPLDYIVQDRNKQDIVYKLVPHLYISELKKRIANRDPDIDDLTKSLLKRNSINVILVLKDTNKYIDPVTNIFTSASANTTSGQPETATQQSPPTCSGEQPQNDIPSAQTNPTGLKNQPIFLRCPFTIKVRCLRKLLIMKYQLGTNDKVAIYYKGDIISDEDLVSNLAQSLIFRFQYQISRVSVKEETIDAYRSESCIDNKYPLEGRLPKRRRHTDDTEEDDDEDDHEDEEDEDEDLTEEENTHDDESTDEDIDIPIPAREQPLPQEQPQTQENVMRQTII